MKMKRPSYSGVRIGMASETTKLPEGPSVCKNNAFQIGHGGYRTAEYHFAPHALHLLPFEAQNQHVSFPPTMP